MPTIEVDFDVYKALIARRPTEQVTENDVLRDLLRLPRQPSAAQKASLPRRDDWVTKGVRLPSGTEFRTTYKGVAYLAQVADGALVLDGRRFSSPSAAAMHITQHPVNGWTFWQCKLPGQARWIVLKELREKSP
jgi:hypothetical protein